VVLDGISGALSEDLAAAALRCLQLDPRQCRQHALRYSWESCTRQFIAMLATGNEPRDVAAAAQSM
jgi:hypothetical protein